MFDKSNKPTKKTLDDLLSSKDVITEKEVKSDRNTKGQFNRNIEPHNKKSLFFAETNEKICSLCLEKKSTSDFPKINKNSETLYSQCKSCVSIRNKINKEKKRNERMNQILEKNPGAKLNLSKYAHATKRAFYFPETNEKICAKCDEKFNVSNFFRHKETIDGFHSWCKKCCTIGNQKSRVKKYSSFEGRITVLLRTCKISSVKRGGQEMTLTRESLLELWEKQKRLCFYTDIEMDTQPELFNSVSVERIDSKIGYTIENVVLVCNVINRMKSDLTLELFFEMCKKVSLKNS